MIGSQHRQLQTVSVAQVEEPLYFVDFLREPTFDNETGEVIDAHPSFYDSIQGGLPDIRKRVEALQRKFNEESKAVKLELVLFQDALTHLMRISRLLAMDRGSVLLVGVGGSGKQSLSRLAAYIAGKLSHQPLCIEVVLGRSSVPCGTISVAFADFRSCQDYLVTGSGKALSLCLSPAVNRIVILHNSHVPLSGAAGHAVGSCRCHAFPDHYH